MALYKDRICLGAVSKNGKGLLSRSARKKDRCSAPKCTTLKDRYRLKMKLKAHKKCDRVAGLSGSFRSPDLVVVTDVKPEGRGVHEGPFSWSGNAGKIQGRMRGTTNVGTHRRPLRKCEFCHQAGHMEGFLDGKFVSGKMKGYRLTATYALNYDPGNDKTIPVLATIEGAVLVPCKKK